MYLFPFGRENPGPFQSKKKTCMAGPKREGVRGTRKEEVFPIHPVIRPTRQERVFTAEEATKG